MHIAICDDDCLELSRISTHVNKYRNEKKFNITYSLFQSSSELCSSIKSSNYDAIFLDILMPGTSGMEAAHEIRNLDSSVKIIFITSTPEFALESYQVKAVNYLLKPINSETLYSIFDNLVKEQNTDFDSFLIIDQGTLFKIQYNKICYIESNGNQLKFNMIDGIVYEINAKLSDYESKFLFRSEFMKVSKYCIVNLWYMNKLNYDGFISSTGKAIPVSRLIYEKVKKSFVDHLFIEKEVL